jgi:TPR repeat protein
MPENNSEAPSRWATIGGILILCSKVLIPISVFLLIVTWVVGIYDSFKADKGVAAYQKKDYATALQVFQSVPTDGRAQFYLGLMYRNGRGVPKDDAEAAKWYLKAAQNGRLIAEYNLALLYDDPKSPVYNQKQALIWYEDAAKRGDASAQVNLGFKYAHGEGVAEDHKEAVKWYRKSAEQGDATGQLDLGLELYHGQGVSKDPVQAYEWVTLAANQGYAGASKIRDRMRTELTPEQVAQGETLAKNFKVK